MTAGRRPAGRDLRAPRRAGAARGQPRRRRLRGVRGRRALELRRHPRPCPRDRRRAAAARRAPGRPGSDHAAERRHGPARDVRRQLPRRGHGAGQHRLPRRAAGARDRRFRRPRRGDRRRPDRSGAGGDDRRAAEHRGSGERSAARSTRRPGAARPGDPAAVRRPAAAAGAADRAVGHPVDHLHLRHHRPLEGRAVVLRPQLHRHEPADLDLHPGRRPPPAAHADLPHRRRLHRVHGAVRRRLGGGGRAVPHRGVLARWSAGSR